jgi:beta-lactamase regulating signal transducer with metallopeptidase domain
MTASATFLLACALKSGVVLAVAALVNAALKRRDAALRHAIWMMAIGGTLLIPIGASSGPSLIIDIPRDHVVERWIPVQSTGGEAPSLNATSSQGTTAAPSSRPAGLATVLVSVWLCGAVAMLVRLAIELCRVMALVRRARQVAPGPVPIHVTGEITVPMTAGVWRPVILLPREMESYTTAQERWSVLAHERAHIQRRDNLLHAIARVASALYWFNPLIWIAVRAMHTEAERACDDEVLRRGAAPGEYAATLVAFARRLGHRSMPALRPVTGPTAELEHRLQAILNAATDRRRSPIAWCVAGLTAAVIVGGTATLGLRAAPTSVVMPRAQDIDVPLSERIPLSIEARERARRTALLISGPDAQFARTLAHRLEQAEQHAADLVAERAAWALLQARDGRLVTPLIDRLDSADWREAAYAAWALAVSEGRESVPPLMRALQHPVWRVRANAAAAIANHVDSRAVAVMSVALDDTAWQVRTEAVRFFGRRGDAESLARIRPALADRHIAVRTEASRYLGGSR